MTAHKPGVELGRSGRGGKRPGAGRKKGDKVRAADVIEAMRARLDKAEDLATPLEVMLVAMRDMLKRADEVAATEARAIVEKDETGKVIIITDIDLRMQAVEIAAKAAPYCHPRLAQVESNITAKVQHYEDSLLALNDPAESAG
jgi:hypothetical protein